MIPAVIYAADSIELSRTGKAKLASGYVAPRNDVEREMSRELEQLTKTPRISVNDRFRDLGGDSLTMIRFLARYSYLSPQDFENNPSIAMLAAIEHRSSRAPGEHFVEFELPTRVLDILHTFSRKTALLGLHLSRIGRLAGIADQNDYLILKMVGRYPAGHDAGRMIESLFRLHPLLGARYRRSRKFQFLKRHDWNSVIYHDLSTPDVEYHLWKMHYLYDRPLCIANVDSETRKVTLFIHHIICDVHSIHVMHEDWQRIIEYSDSVVFTDCKVYAAVGEAMRQTKYSHVVEATGFDLGISNSTRRRCVHAERKMLRPISRSDWGMIHVLIEAMVLTCGSKSPPYYLVLNCDLRSDFKFNISRTVGCLIENYVYCYNGFIIVREPAHNWIEQNRITLTLVSSDEEPTTQGSEYSYLLPTSEPRNEIGIYVYRYPSHTDILINIVGPYERVSIIASKIFPSIEMLIEK